MWKRYVLKHDDASVWIVADGRSGLDYSYGGTRMVGWQSPDEQVESVAIRLMHYESGLKNGLINRVFETPLFKDMEQVMPAGLLKSRVGGARCIIRPRNKRVSEVMSNPRCPDFDSTAGSIFEMVGSFLNDLDGRIKLTPDFGKFSGVADILYRHTPHVLGIGCGGGGCGGKASYTSTGIIQTMISLGYGSGNNFHIPATLIGSHGACGRGVLDYLLRGCWRDVAVCDLVYDDPVEKAAVPEGVISLGSSRGSFTDECLKRGGLIVATTVGNELVHSNWRVMPEGTVLLLAHNDALPEGRDGVNLVGELYSRGVMVMPGQALTFGGALASRVEWFWRLRKRGAPFDKSLAHTLVARTADYWMRTIRSEAGGANAYEFLLSQYEPS